MPAVVCYEINFELLKAALAQVKVNGLYLKSGVASGRSINFIMQHVGQTVHGFDSFEGLPEDWTAGEGKGHSTGTGDYLLFGSFMSGGSINPYPGLPQLTKSRSRS
jgi:hypothetical protein